MKIGTTSFAFRYLLLYETPAPEALLDRAAALQLDVLQICENARPMSLSAARWREVVAYGERLGVEVQLGCKTLSAGEIEGHLERARATPSRMLRVVFEQEEAPRPAAAELADLLARLWPAIDRCGTRLAIENHFEVPSRVLSEVVQPYSKERVGFCLDTANSLRNFESPEQVMCLLGERAFCYHVKDFQVAGCLLGFTVGGAPLGTGRLDLAGTLDRILARDPDAEILVENWVPSSGDRTKDVLEDQCWLEASLGKLRRQLLSRNRC